MSLADFPYLNTVVEAGLRTSPPNTSGLSHVVPIGGDIVCGEWFPKNVIFYHILIAFLSRKHVTSILFQSVDNIVDLCLCTPMVESFLLSR